jgi:crotonobetainyl-CoA:carnitine CoA-transferase CaiB-like acyl-CoA transferase
MDDILEHPLFEERQMVEQFYTSNGARRKTLGIPVKLSETPGSLRSAPASFGNDTDSILIELGYSDEKIEDLRGKGVL